MIVERRERFIGYFVLVAFTLAALYPIVSLVTIALQRPGEGVTGVSLTHGLSFDAFRRAWVEGGFASAMASSAIVAIVVTVGCAALSTLAGYAFGTMSFPGRDVLFYVMLLGMIVPYEATIIPLYYDFRAVGLDNTYWGLILPQLGLAVSFGTFWMRAYFRTAPTELIEAAQIDGAGTLRTLVRVLLPGARPALLTLMTLTFMWTWNEFLLALVMVQDEDLRTAPLALAFFSNNARHRDLSLVAASAVLVALPVMMVYVVLQRQFISGLLAGSVKE